MTQIIAAAGDSHGGGSHFDSTVTAAPVPELVRPHRPGDVLAGKYRLLLPKAAGGMGAIWAATNIDLDLPVVVKLLHRDHDGCEAERTFLGERLWREARAAATVRHSAVVRVFDFGFTEWDDPYIVMELLEGESLAETIAREGRLSPARALQIMLPIADGLVAVHALGIIHRDLKPDNIFLAQENQRDLQPKIIDFGLAMLPWMGSLGNLTGAVVFGTPEYMAPEQAIASDEVDERVDIWSYCVVLYEMLSAALPSPSENFPAAPSAPGVDEKLWAILQRGLCRNPKERWTSMQQLGASLADWLRSHGVTEDVTGASLRTRWPTDRDGPPELSGTEGLATLDSWIACGVESKGARSLLEGGCQVDCR